MSSAVTFDFGVARGFEGGMWLCLGAWAWAWAYVLECTHSHVVVEVAWALLGRGWCFTAWLEIHSALVDPTTSGACWLSWSGQGADSSSLAWESGKRKGPSRILSTLRRP